MASLFADLTSPAASLTRLVSTTRMTFGRLTRSCINGSIDQTRNNSEFLSCSSARLALTVAAVTKGRDALKAVGARDERHKQTSRSEDDVKAFLSSCSEGANYQTRVSR